MSIKHGSAQIRASYCMDQPACHMLKSNVSQCDIVLRAMPYNLKSSICDWILEN